MLTCLAQMPVRKKVRGQTGFTLAELLVALLMISLFTLLAGRNLFGLLRKSTFKAQVQEFVSTMQMAASAASASNRRYEVIIDITEQSYMLREIDASEELSPEVLEEGIIVDNDFGSRCYVVYVEFDDGVYSNEAGGKFRVGRAGWQNGGKIVLLDEDEMPYSVMVNRLNRIVTLREGDIELLEPKFKEDLPY